MDAFERQPEPPRKRKRSTKKIGGDNLTPPPTPAEERAQVSGAQNESTQPKRRRSQKQKTVQQEAAAPGQAPGVGQLQTLPVTPAANLEEAHQTDLAATPRVIHSMATSADIQPASAGKGASSASATVKGEGKEAVSPETRILARVLKGVVWLVNLCSNAIILILLGFNPPVTDIPVLDFIQHYKLTTLIILSMVVVLMLVTLVGWQFLNKRLQPIDVRLKAMGAVTGISTLSSLICLSLLMITLVRPSWCPTALCAAPRVVTKPITTTQGVHDANLDVYFVSFESTAFVIPGDPAQPAYIPSNGDPRSIGVVMPDAPKTATPYTIAIGLHSLYTGRYSIFIDKVSLLVTGVSRVSDPLRVYAPAVLTTYSSTNPSLFVYQGQQAGQVIADTYSTNPLPRVELRSGESDQIDAAIEARIPGDVQFIIQVTYHIATEQQRFTLTLNHTFDAVFAPASNWQKYQLNLAQNDFTPAPSK